MHWNFVPEESFWTRFYNSAFWLIVVSVMVSICCKKKDFWGEGVGIVLLRMTVFIWLDPEEECLLLTLKLPYKWMSFIKACSYLTLHVNVLYEYWESFCINISRENIPSYVSLKCSWKYQYFMGRKGDTGPVFRMTSDVNMWDISHPN